jgi:hypothetical protein
MSFHPQYWNRPVKNSSKGYNYYLWNQQDRGEHVAEFLKEDPRPLPKSTEPLDDVNGKKGAPVVDEECTGTTMRDYLRGTDLAHIPDDLIALYDDGTGAAGQLIYRPQDLGVLLLDQDMR